MEKVRKTLTIVGGAIEMLDKDTANVAKARVSFELARAQGADATTQRATREQMERINAQNAALQEMILKLTDTDSIEEARAKFQRLSIVMQMVGELEHEVAVGEQIINLYNDSLTANDEPEFGDKLKALERNRKQLSTARATLAKLAAEAEIPEASAIDLVAPLAIGR